MFQAVDLNDYKKQIHEYVESRMTFIAPNLSIIVGASTAAKLMGKSLASYFSTFNSEGINELVMHHHFCLKVALKCKFLLNHAIWCTSDQNKLPYMIPYLTK